ncbi:hypothetical protein G6F21_014777 [Rhizopus arrhizus]|nr:hypothetical protein G6F21_014777 [Rhizopus arrhizus]
MRVRAHRARGRTHCALGLRAAGGAAHRGAVRHPWPVRSAGAPAARQQSDRCPGPLGNGQGHPGHRR